MRRRPMLPRFGKGGSASFVNHFAYDRLFRAFTDFDKTRDVRMDVLIAKSVFCKEEFIALFFVFGKIASDRYEFVIFVDCAVLKEGGGVTTGVIEFKITFLQISADGSELTGSIRKRRLVR